MLLDFRDVRNGRESGVLGRSGAGGVMSENPYESPREPSGRSTDRSYSGVRLVLWVLLFFIGVPVLDGLFMLRIVGLTTVRPRDAQIFGVYVGLTLAIILALCVIPRSHNVR